MFVDPKNMMGAQFARTAEDMNSLMASMFPGLPSFARHMLLAQREVLRGITSLVDAQLETLEDIPRRAPCAPGAATAKAHGPEKIRITPEEPPTL